jgi:Fibronectin type III domain/Bacterial Ig domain
MLSRLNRSQSLISTCFFVLAVLIWHENVDAASLQLSWADNSQNEDGFDIERKTGNGGAFLALTTIPANQSSYTDTNLSNGTTYCYRVRAFNSVGGSPYSNEACATTSASAPTPLPPPTANTISTNIANGATLSGSSVVWTAVPSGVPVRVEFFIDGTLGTTELYAPYQFNGDPEGVLNTNTLANGSHQLKVRATYTDGSIAERTVAVTVSNTSSTPTPSPTVNTISTNIANGATLNGSSVVWTAVPSGVPVRVEFFIDGTLGTTEFQSPYQFNGDPSGVLNTKTLANGSHQLKVRATYADKSIAERTIAVTVSNT